MRTPLRYFNSPPKVVGLTVMTHIRYPLSLRQVEDLLFERGVDSREGRDWDRGASAAWTPAR